MGWGGSSGGTGVVVLLLLQRFEVGGVRKVALVAWQRESLLGGRARQLSQDFAGQRGSGRLAGLPWLQATFVCKWVPGKHSMCAAAL